jgi:cold shock CspA family protein
MDTGHRHGARLPRLRGTIKFIDRIADFGFIQRPGYPDVYFTAANVERGGRLERFDGVAYDLDESADGRPCARRVRKIELE